MNLIRTVSIISFLFLANGLIHAQDSTKKRGRDLGIPFSGVTGKYNAITDVPGIEVGYKTLISGSGKRAVRTGVTVILPKGKTDKSYPAAWFSLNGDGEMTGLPYIEDYGRGSGPIAITNTNSVGVVRDAVGEWSVKKFSNDNQVDFSFGLPVVGETWDGMLNDINGFHVKKEDVWQALDNASTGKIKEGNVGGGTGMICYWFKGGSGTASRVFTIDSVQYTLGVFVQANFGSRKDLMVAGVPVGKQIQDLEPVENQVDRKDGSIIAIVATDAPLLPGALKLVAKRVTHGIARTGSISSNGSGEIFLALSTALPQYNKEYTQETWKVISKWNLDPIFRATVEATEEAIINAMLAAEDMEGKNGNKVFALPHKRLQEVLEKNLTDKYNLDFMGAEKLAASLESGNHSLLKQLAGEWAGETKTWFEPGDPVDVSPMRGTIRPLFDGRFVMHEYKGSFQGAAFEGLSIHGYNMNDKLFQSAWVDTFHMGTGIMFSQSVKTAPFYNVRGTYLAGEDEQQWGWRTEIKVIGPDEIVFTAYNITPSGEESKATETIYKRVV